MIPTVIAVAIHILAAVVWVGGMFFAYLILRPSAGPLEPPERLKLWSRVFARFFPWVWAAVVALPATGYWQVMMDFGGFKNVGLHVHVMQALGLVMIFLYVYLFGGPYTRFQKAVAAADWPAAGGQLNTIRRIVGTNLVLGLIVSAVGASGRFW